MLRLARRWGTQENSLQVAGDSGQNVVQQPSGSAQACEGHSRSVASFQPAPSLPCAADLGPIRHQFLCHRSDSAILRHHSASKLASATLAAHALSTLARWLLTPSRLRVPAPLGYMVQTLTSRRRKRRRQLPRNAHRAAVPNAQAQESTRLFALQSTEQARTLMRNHAAAATRTEG